MSDWYQDTPNGAPGCWITKRSKPMLCGMPVSVTFMTSLRRPVVIVACPAACGRQALIADATTPAPAMVTAFAAVGARMLRMLGRLLLIAGPPVTAAAPPPPSG